MKGGDGLAFVLHHNADGLFAVIDCGENNLVLLYDAAQGGVLGLVHQAGRNTLLGDPSPAMAAELEKLWRQEWRQGR